MSGELGSAGFKKRSIIDDLAAGNHTLDNAARAKSYDAPRQSEDDFTGADVRFSEETLPETLNKMQEYISKTALSDTIEDPHA